MTLLTTRDSPLPPHEKEFFLFFCDREEQQDFISFIEDMMGFAISDEGALREAERQECSMHGTGSEAGYFALIRLQKPNFGSEQLTA